MGFGYGCRRSRRYCQSHWHAPSSRCSIEDYLPLVKANKAGLDVNANQLEAHYLAGGDVDRVVDALIAAHRATMSLTFERACAIDLAGRDVLEAVQMSVNPKVIETPFISAVAQMVLN